MSSSSLMTSLSCSKSGLPSGSAFAWSIIAWSFTASPSTAIAERGGLLTELRIARRVAGILLLFAFCCPVHIATRRLLGQSRWPARFLSAVAWLCGARVSLAGDPLRAHSLVIANHTSWLDILILGGSAASAFVSKENLGHGLLHWLADQNGTVYVKRQHRKDSKNQALAIARALHRGQPVTVFPETTTGPGTSLLPFRSTLIESAAYAERDVELRPVAVDYGEAAAEIAWWHEPGLSNVRRLLGRKGTLPVTLRLLPPLPRGLDRKQLAHRARGEIASALGLEPALQVDAQLSYRAGE